MEVEPDFINESGVKWFKSDSWYANLKLGDKVKVWLIEHPTKLKEYVLVDHNTDTILANDNTLEGIGVKIDVIQFLRRPSEVT